MPIVCILRRSFRICKRVSASRPSNRSVIGRPAAFSTRTEDIWKIKLQTTVPVEHIMACMVPTKSSNDPKEYRVIKLKNGLTVLLIADHSGGPISDTSLNNWKSHAQKKGSNGNTGKAKQTQDEALVQSDDSDSNWEDCSEDGTSSGEDGSVSDDESSMDEGQEPRNDREMEGGRRRRIAKKDEEEKLSAVAMSIAVGSFSDPADIQGLAHFLEHMIFMGSEKYPVENELDAYISAHGGSSNAFTDSENTVFHFDIQAPFLAGALDRFAQLFIHPLLKKDSGDREIEAVDSEFKMSVTDDACRIERLISTLADTGHPMSKFAWGNKESLDVYPKSVGIDVYDRLKKFCERYYIGPNMKLVVQSQASLDALEKCVQDIFDGVPDGKIPTPVYDSNKNAFDNPAFNRIYKVVPMKNMHQVVLTWSLQSIKHAYKVKPLLYINWLFGHEGKGSIAAHLKKKNWALKVECGGEETGWESNSTGSLISIIITLTPDGLNCLDLVIGVVFEYILLMQKNGPQEYIYNEIKLIQDNEFRWIEQIDPQDYVENLAISMQAYPPEDFLTGDRLLSLFDAELIGACTAKLTPDRVNIIVLSKNYDEKLCNLSEKWFQIQYRVDDIPLEWRTRWSEITVNSDIAPASKKMKIEAPLIEGRHLPLKNEYIATDFSLKTPDMPDTEYPVVIRVTEKSRLFYKRDGKFNEPRTYAQFYLKSASVNESARNRCLMDIFVKMLERRLEESMYQAELANFEINLKLLECGLEITVSGFSDKLPKVFHAIFDELTNDDVNENLFNVIQNEFKLEYYNQLMKPETFTKDIRLSLMLQNHWTMADKSACLSSITADDLARFVSNLSFFVEGLVQGNITAAEAKELEDYLLKNIATCPESTVPNFSVTRLADSADGVCIRYKNVNPADNNCIAMNYYQHGPGVLQEEILMELLLSHMYEPCFEQLRTQRQIGYLVTSSVRHHRNILGYYILVGSQSSKFSMKDIDGEIEAFLRAYSKKIQKMQLKRFKCLVDSEISLRRSGDSNLGDEVSRNWDEIALQTYLFDRLKQEIAELEKVTLDQFKSWALLHLAQGPTRRKLAVQVVGRKLKNTKKEKRSKKTTASARAGVNNTSSKSSQVLNDEMEKSEVLNDEMEDSTAVNNHGSVEESLAVNENAVKENAVPTPQYDAIRLELDARGPNCIADPAAYMALRKIYPPFVPVPPSIYVKE